MFNKSKEILCSVLLLILFMAFAISAAAVETVKVGAIYPLTGSISPLGINCMNAVKLAAEIVNNSYDMSLSLAKTVGLPGLGGAKIEVIFADSQGTPINGQAEAERLITKQNVVGIVGCYQSSVAITISKVCEREKVCFIGSDVVADSLTDPGYKYFFRPSVTNYTYSKVIFDFMKVLNESGAGLKTVALVYENTEYGVNNATIQEKMAQEYGFDVVLSLSYTSNSTDLSSEVQRLKVANPDAIMHSAYASDAILFTKTYKSQNYAPNLIFAPGAGFAIPTYFENVGDDGNYVINSVAWNIDLVKSNPSAKKVADLYYEKYGKTLDDVSARSFIGAMVMFMAIDKAGSTDTDKIQEALLETDIDASELIATWGVKFDPKTHENVRVSAVLIQNLDQRGQVIWPFEAKVADYIMPVPAWTDR